MSHSYIDIAKMDYEWINIDMENSDILGRYNRPLVTLQQTAEKYLKGYISENLNIDGKYDKALTTHNLRLLVNIINENCATDLNPKDAKYLGDFYFDLRYPGANFEVITDRNIAVECREICETIMNTIDKLVAQRKLEGTAFFGKLPE